MAETYQSIYKKLINNLEQEGFITSDGQRDALSSFLQLVQSHPGTLHNRSKATKLLTRAVGDESKNRGKRIKAICLKFILPSIYDANKEKPLTDVLCFLQPTQGMNQTFRYLYQKLEKEFPWRLRLYELHREEQTREGYYAQAAWFVKDMATSPAVFVHESGNLMSHLSIRSETQIIQLWHGCGVLKKIGLSTAGLPGYKTLEDYKEYPEYNNYSLVTIASPEQSWVFEEFMGISKDSGIIQPLGIARTDEFYDDGYYNRSKEKLYREIPNAKNKKVILYAPTYRGKGKERTAPNALDISLMAKMLGEDYLLIIKHHQTVRDLPKIPQEFYGTFAFDMTKSHNMDINELMMVADICITDYSSVAFEFSLFNRPLFFFTYDLEDYMKNRGLYYDFEEIMPGTLCHTTAELAESIRQTEKDFDSTEITSFRNRFMSCCDGHACERVIRFLVDRTIPVPEDFDKPDFLGWNLYKIKGTKKIWMMEDSSWQEESQVDISGEKKLIADKKTLESLINPNDAIYYSPCWKEGSFTGKKRDSISLKAQRNIEKIWYKIHSQFLKK